MTPPPKKKLRSLGQAFGGRVSATVFRIACNALRVPYLKLARCVRRVCPAADCSNVNFSFREVCNKVSRSYSCCNPPCFRLLLFMSTLFSTTALLL